MFVCHQLFHHTSANLNYEFNKKWNINMYFFSPFNCTLANWFCKNSYCKLFYIMAIITCDDKASKAKTLELGRVTINLFLHQCRHFCCLRMGNIFLWAHTVFWQESIIFVYFGFKLHLLHKSKMCKKRSEQNHAINSAGIQSMNIMRRKSHLNECVVVLKLWNKFNCKPKTLIFMTHTHAFLSVYLL